MAIPTLVQSVVSEPHGLVSPSGTLAYASNVVAGNTLLCLSVIYTGGATLADSQGNTWTRATNSTLWNGTYRMCVFTAVAGSSGANTITMTIGAGNDVCGTVLAEVSGLSVNPFDQLSSSNASTASPATTGVVAPGASGVYALAFFNRSGGSSGGYSTSGSFTLQNQALDDVSCIADYVLPDTTLVQASIACATSVAYPITGMLATFLAAPAAPYLAVPSHLRPAPFKPGTPSRKYGSVGIN